MINRLDHRFSTSRFISGCPPVSWLANMLMINQETIFSKINSIKRSDLELLEDMKPQYKVCPNCGAIDCCSPYASYGRCMISIESGVRKEHYLTIQRVICGSCNSTHALLADVLIPYGSYSLRFILHTLRAYLNRTCTVAALCNRYNIAISTLYRWIDLFKEHANLWLSVLEQILQISVEALDHFENIQLLPSSFFQRYGFSFLQSRKTTHCIRDP